VFFSLLLAVCFSLSQVAFSFDEIDTDNICSIELIYQDNGIPIEGASFQLYFVADVNDDVEMTDDFADSGIELTVENSDEWSDNASTLCSYIELEKANGIDIDIAAEGVTDEDGKLTFSNLETGVYLLVGDVEQMNGVKYEPADTLLMLPTEQDDDTLDYDVTIYPKGESENIPTDNTPNTPNTPSSDDKYTELSVQKIWNDTGYESSRPDSVTVVLLQDGKEYDTVVLNKANNWRYKWDNLDKNSSWKLAEENVPENYTVTSVLDGNTFIVTNTRKQSRGHGGNGKSRNTSSSVTEKATENVTEDVTENPENPSDTVPKHSDSTNTPEDTPETTTDNFDTSEPEDEVTSTDATTETPTNTPADNSVPPTDNPNNEKLPQTGQLWLPIPLFLVCGLILFMLGIKLSGGKNDEK
jgi:hypothetical protein